MHTRARLLVRIRNHFEEAGLKVLSSRDFEARIRTQKAADRRDCLLAHRLVSAKARADSSRDHAIRPTCLRRRETGMGAPAEEGREEEG